MTTMLYPQSNACRQTADLSGFWDFRFDVADEGLSQGWGAGFDPAEIIAVPANAAASSSWPAALSTMP